MCVVSGVKVIDVTDLLCGVAGVKIVGGVALGTVAAAVALGAAVVALPVWGGFKITKRIGHRISARGSFEPEVPYEDALEAMPGVYRRVCRD